MKSRCRKVCLESKCVFFLSCNLAAIRVPKHAAEKPLHCVGGHVLLLPVPFGELPLGVDDGIMLEVLRRIQKAIAGVAISPDGGACLGAKQVPNCQGGGACLGAKRVPSCHRGVLLGQKGRGLGAMRVPNRHRALLGTVDRPNIWRLLPNTPVRTNFLITSSKVRISLLLRMAKKLLPVSRRLSPVEDNSAPAITTVFWPMVTCL